VVLGIPLVFATASAAWRAKRHRVSAGVAFAMAGLLAIGLFDTIILALTGAFK
jgi:hypothetical protein